MRRRGFTRPHRNRLPKQTVRARARRLAPRPFSLSAHQERACVRLRAFRQGSALAVALTALLLMVTGVVDDSAGQEMQPVPDVPVNPRQSIDQATATILEVVQTSYALLPKLALAVLLIGGAMLTARIASAILRRTLGRWEKAAAVSALVRIALYVGAIAVSLSVLAGDASAVLGSLGLVGLALSWALQTPIESFTGWLLNSFRGYYRVGDRIEVGDVFGDVYKIDVLTTTVWEAGGPGKSVAGAQPTGAMNVPELGSAAVQHHQLQPRLSIRVGRGDGDRRKRKRPAVHGPGAGDSCRRDRRRWHA